MTIPLHSLVMPAWNIGWTDRTTGVSVALFVGMLVLTVWFLRAIVRANQRTSEALTKEQTRRAEADASLRKQAAGVSARLIGYDPLDDRDPAVEIFNRSTGPVFNVEVRLSPRDIELRDLDGGQQWLDQVVAVSTRDGIVTTPDVHPGVEPKMLQVHQWPTVDDMRLAPPEDPTQSKALYRQLNMSGPAFATAMSPGNGSSMQATDFLDSHQHASAAVTRLFNDFVRLTLNTYADGLPHFASGRLTLRFTDGNNQRWERSDGGALSHLGPVE